LQYTLLFNNQLRDFSGHTHVLFKYIFDDTTTRVNLNITRPFKRYEHEGKYDYITYK